MNRKRIYNEEELKRMEPMVDGLMPLAIRLTVATMAIGDCSTWGFFKTKIREYKGHSKEKIKRIAVDAHKDLLIYAKENITSDMKYGKEQFAKIEKIVDLVTSLWADSVDFGALYSDPALLTIEVMRSSEELVIKMIDLKHDK